MIVTLTGMSTSGKSTFAKALSATPYFEEAVSLTTRSMRPGEVHCKDYYFVTQEEFDDYVTDGSMIEYVNSHHASYGVPTFEVKRIIDGGKNPVMVLEPKGAGAINRFAVKHSMDLISAFVSAPESLLVERFFRRIELQIKTGERIDYVAHAKRLHTMISQERYWREVFNWDVILESLHVEKNLAGAKERFCKSLECPGNFIPLERERCFKIPSTPTKVDDIEVLVRGVMEGKISKERVREQLIP